MGKKNIFLGCHLNLTAGTTSQQSYLAELVLGLVTGEALKIWVMTLGSSVCCFLRRKKNHQSFRVLLR